MASLHSRTVVALLLTLAAMTFTARSMSIMDLPEINCADTDLQHCSQCHYSVANGVTYYLCAICVDTDTQQYSPATQGESMGLCLPYNPANCNVAGCHKCASDDATQCAVCDYGVPDKDTAECLGESISSATGGKYTSAAPSTTTTTTTTTTPAPTTTTTTTTTPAPTTTTTTPAPTTTTTTTTTKPPTTTTTSSTRAPTTTTTTSTTKPPTTTTTTPGPTTTTTTTKPPATTTTTTKPPATTTTTTTRAPTTTTTTSRTPSTSSTTTTSVCPIANCLNCTSQNVVCSVCVLGYTLTETGTCMQSGSCSVTNCVQCSTTSATECMTCVAGYARNANGGCTRKTTNASPSRMSAVSVTVALAIAAAAYLA